MWAFFQKFVEFINNERTTSPLYGVYAISFVIWNWKIIYTLFWEDKGIFSSSPRVDYVQQNFLFQSNPNGDIWPALINILWILIPPAVLTFIIIMWMPRLHAWAHRLSVRAHFDRKAVFYQERLLYETMEQKNLKSLAEVTQEQVKIKKEIVENLTQEEQWGLEFEEFKKSSKKEDFGAVLRVIYHYGGRVSSAGSRMVGAQAVAEADTRGLISIDQNGTMIHLTDKGKIFAKNYLKENRI